MSRSLYENHWGSPTLTLLNVLGVLGVLNVLNVLYVPHLLHVLNMPMDASLARWALLVFENDRFSLQTHCDCVANSFSSALQTHCDCVADSFSFALHLQCK